MEKKLNLFDLISIGVGCIVGSGIFALLGVGIAFTGRGIVIALFLAMFLCVLQCSPTSLSWTAATTRSTP